MERILNWRKGLFDSNYQVFEGTYLKFSINFSSLKNSAIATTQKGIYLLRSDGYSNPETKILNSNHELLATIRYDWLAFKARVTFANGENFDWSYQNSWLSRWSLNNHTDRQIIYNSSTSNGLIHGNTDDDMLFFIGLFIREYYSRILYAMVLIVLFMSFIRNVFY